MRKGLRRAVKGQVSKDEQGKKEREPDIEEIADERVENPSFLPLPKIVEIKSEVLRLKNRISRPLREGSRQYTAGEGKVFLME